MDTMQISVIVLMYVTSIVLIVLAVFVIRLLISTTKLSENVNQITKSVQDEVEPTLKELREAAKSINSIANTADTHLGYAKNTLKKAFCATSFLGSKLKSILSGVVKGIGFGINLFRK